MCVCVCVCVAGATILQSGVLSLRTRSRATSSKTSSGGALGYSQRGTQRVLRGTQGYSGVLTGTITTHTQSSHQPESQLVQTHDLSCAAAHQLPSTHGVLSGYSQGTTWELYNGATPSRAPSPADGRRGEPILGADGRRGEPVMEADGRRGEPIFGCRWAQVPSPRCGCKHGGEPTYFLRFRAVSSSSLRRGPTPRWKSARHTRSYQRVLQMATFAKPGVNMGSPRPTSAPGLQWLTPALVRAAQGMCAEGVLRVLTGVL